MKNRKLIYILIPLVFGIWGIIAYNIYSHLHNPAKADEDFYIHKKHKQKNIADTGYTLLANYRDPFAPGYSGDNSQRYSSAMKITRQKFVPQNIWVNWPSVEFKGIILNKNRKIALVRIDGANYLLDEGIEIKKIKLVKMYNDSIELVYQNDKKVFVKNRSDL